MVSVLNGITILSDSKILGLILGFNNHMSQTDTVATVKQVPLKDIIPDSGQPRKNFDVGRLGDLMKSIQKHGIMNPLMIEKKDEGYQLIDGERRFRAATALKLKTVPAIVRPPLADVERIVEQFHLQEQHEGWSSTEKAVAAGNLARTLGVGVNDVARMLSIPETTVSRWLALSDLAKNKEFVKYDIPIEYARKIVSLRKFAKSTYESEIGEEFTPKMSDDLEMAIIERIRSREVTIPAHLVKVRDTFKADPKQIAKFIKNKGTSIAKMFLQSDAKLQSHVRNLLIFSGGVTHHANMIEQLGGIKVIENSPDMVSKLRNVQNSIDNILGKR